MVTNFMQQIHRLPAAGYPGLAVGLVNQAVCDLLGGDLTALLWLKSPICAEILAIYGGEPGMIYRFLAQKEKIILAKARKKGFVGPEFERERPLLWIWAALDKDKTL